jgi:hypothetical protein
VGVHGAAAAAAVPVSVSVATAVAAGAEGDDGTSMANRRLVRAGAGVQAAPLRLRRVLGAVDSGDAVLVCTIARRVAASVYVVCWLERPACKCGCAGLSRQSYFTPSRE